MDWIARLFPRHELGRVGADAFVRLPARISSPVTVRSVTRGEPAAAVRWSLRTVLDPEDDARRLFPRVLRPFCSGWDGASIVVRAPCGGEIQVPLGPHVALDGPHDPLDEAPLSSSPELRARYGALAPQRPGLLDVRGEMTRGVVYVREQVLAPDQPLELHGFVGPRRAAVGYRAPSGDGPAYVALREITLVIRS